MIAFPLSLICIRGASALGINLAELAGKSPLKCPLNLLLQIQCPTCGLTRSLLYAWSGDFEISLRYHFGGIALLVVGILGFLFLALNWENKVSKVTKRLRQQPEFRFFLYTSIFLYSLWGFFLRNNI